MTLTKRERDELRRLYEEGDPQKARAIVQRLRNTLPALLDAADELTAERDKRERAEAACAEYRDALDAIYNHNEAARAAVVQHYGTLHESDAGRAYAERMGRYREALERISKAVGAEDYNQAIAIIADFQRIAREALQEPSDDS